MHLPHAKQHLLTTLLADLTAIDNIAAVVLGGSHATGQATEKSDLDVGIYYYHKAPFEVADIRAVAEKYATETPTVTGFYEWGPWVNGGAWIETSAGKVDLLYKNVEQIQATIAQAKNGVWENHFEQQPPYGFSSVMFLAETHVCIPLYDPAGVIGALKAEVAVYPEKLKAAIIQQCLWSAEFTIAHAEGFFRKKDVYNTVGCLTRAVKNIVSVLFAINEVYPITDKRAMETLEKCTKIPENLKNKVAGILCVDPDLKTDNVGALRALFQETIALADSGYQPFYHFKSE